MFGHVATRFQKSNCRVSMSNGKINGATMRVYKHKMYKGSFVGLEAKMQLLAGRTEYKMVITVLPGH